ncbi:MAG TPA: enoyl-ACP reductase [Nitrospiria bacterium]|nr:enoyl-ACP reductase [Nitrospiria bacterium]
MGLLEGRKGIIFGVANEKSIAWSIAKLFHKEGAELAFTYAGEALEKRVRPLADSLGAKQVHPCDVSRDEEIREVFGKVGEAFGRIHLLVHAVAFANRDDLKGDFLQTSRDGFRLALDVSTYSLAAVSREAAPYMEGTNGSILTLSYLGGERVVPRYNVMGVAKAGLEASVRYLAADLGPKGIRVNAISAGPIRTLASAGISGFLEMLHLAAEKAPLRRNVTSEEVAGTALFLASDLSSGITGETIHVDAGYNIMGM